MAIRFKFLLAVGITALFAGSSAFAQAPFTIRRPPDGSTVREKVRVEIPRASIREGGFVAIYLDDKFDVALAPDADTTKPFTYVWDTKAEKKDADGKPTFVADGEHTIRAVLFEPSSQGSDSVAETASSEVKLNLANKIKNGPTSLLLRYKFHEGDNLDYARDSRAIVIGGESSAGQGTGDIDLNASHSKLFIGVDDVRPAEDVNLVRNKLTALSVLFAEREVTLDRDQLTGSTYQELDSRGRVLYANPIGVSLVQGDFIALGIGIDTTLELPTLPITPVTVGQTWRVPGQSLELPGYPAFAQPRVIMENKFEGLEWEAGYQTAKIRQSYTKEGMAKEIRFGSIKISNPKITVDKLIYIGYKSGKLVKTSRTMTIAGRTSDPLPTNTQITGGGNAPGNNGGRPGGPPPGSPDGGGGGASGGRLGGRAGRVPGGRPGGPPGNRGNRGGGFNGNGGNNGNQEADRAITIRVVTDTELQNPEAK